MDEQEQHEKMRAEALQAAMKLLDAAYVCMREARMDGYTAEERRRFREAESLLQELGHEIRASVDRLIAKP